MGIQQILLGGASADAWEPAGITATGGTMHTGQLNPDGTPYTWHVFPGGPRGPESPTPYTFDVTAVSGPGSFEYIMVAGGGMGGMSPNPDPGGSYGGAGGGGAGGLRTNFRSPPAAPAVTYHPFYPESPGAATASVQAYTIQVGRAAAGNPAPERDGKPTSFSGSGGGAPFGTVTGGGHGGHATGGTPAGPGGSGGGGGEPPGGTSGASGTPGQGKAGGDGESAGAGGGGGASTGGGGASGAGGEGAMFDDAGFFKLAVGGIADNPAQPGYRYLAGGGGEPPGGTSGASGTPGQGKAGGDGEPAGAGGGGGASTGGGGGPGAGGEGAMFDDAGFFKLAVGGIADNPAQPGYRYLAGGGGGGGPSGSGIPPGAGGFGGGGEAGNPNNNGGNADNWSGAGGGGAGGGDQTRFAGQGGQGMLFIRYVA